MEHAAAQRGYDITRAWFESCPARTGWLPVMGVFLDDDLIELVLSEAEEALSGYVTGDGAMTFGAPAHIVTAQA